jgi:hypothetical protein
MSQVFVDAINPPAGTIGTLLTIVCAQGGFGTVMGQVNFQDARGGAVFPGVPSQWTDTQIQCPIPTGTPTGVLCTVQVVLPGGSVNAENQVWVSAAPSAAGVADAPQKFPDPNSGSFNITFDDWDLVIDRLRRSPKLVTSAPLDATAAAGTKTPLYTVPAGKAFTPITIIFRGQPLAAAVADASVSVGANAGATDIMPNTALALVRGPNDSWIYNVSGKVPQVPGGTLIQANIGTAATPAAALPLLVEIEGYLS